ETATAAVGGEADAVDAGPTNGGDTPATLGAGAKHREGVVAGQDTGGPALLLGGLLDLLLLVGLVGARELNACDVDERMLGRGNASLGDRFVEQAADQFHRSRQAEPMRRAPRAPHGRKQAALRPCKRAIGLRVA